jgi:UDP-N-acetylglucosamine--N-acetylmuramyl-(pentapeptide) pyrophosphoryl-undecaprenol N-acetylglucosamine transferase
VPAKVRRFLPEMELAYGAATVSLSRSGAASLAETVAMRVPVILVPLPGSADDHQRHNAMNFERTGAARLLEQETAAVADLVKAVGTLLTDTNAREAMREAQSRWHRPDAACLMADRMLAAIGPARKVDAAGATGATLEVLAAPLPT